jgi:hypothetical protein
MLKGNVNKFAAKVAEIFKKNPLTKGTNTKVHQN